MALATAPALTGDMAGQFEIDHEFKPRGDQARTIEILTKGVLQDEYTHQTLMGVTGTGKPFAMANIIERVQRPTLVIAHNKTLAAQLATEFQEYFPHNAVQYFVSYYDYYQPEAYIQRSDTYIEKETDINEEIDRLRHAATRALMTRRDVLIVASVSCIYGMGSPQEYNQIALSLRVGERPGLQRVIRRLVSMYFDRNQMELQRGRFQVKGDIIDVWPADDEIAVRIEFFDDEIEKIRRIDPLTGQILSAHDEFEIFPGKHFITPEDEFGEALAEIEEELEEQLENFRSQGKLLEAERLEQRTRYDLEMLREAGTCAGIENYSQPLGRRPKNSAPWTLLDYFPEKYLLFVDECHVTLPQLAGMFEGDRARKDTLVEHGFRLPSARDNRPLTFGEFEERVNQIIYVSATPDPIRLDGKARTASRLGWYVAEHEQQRANMIIRPTGLVDPKIEVLPTKGQIDDLLQRIRETTAKDERVLVTTLTKRMAEELTDYLREFGVRVQYLHSEINTLERSEILRDLRRGVYDVVVGVNLLREGLDLPEVSLMAILDADREGYLRSGTSLIQTIGRAARNRSGKVVMYADPNSDARLKAFRPDLYSKSRGRPSGRHSVSAGPDAKHEANVDKSESVYAYPGSMRYAIFETLRRRKIQVAHNKANSIIPWTIEKKIHDITERVSGDDELLMVAEDSPEYGTAAEDLPKDELLSIVKDLEKQMKRAATELEFELAASLRDQLTDLRKLMASRGWEEPAGRSRRRSRRLRSV